MLAGCLSCCKPACSCWSLSSPAAMHAAVRSWRGRALPVCQPQPPAPFGVIWTPLILHYTQTAHHCRPSAAWMVLLTFAAQHAPTAHCHPLMGGHGSKLGCVHWHFPFTFSRNPLQSLFSPHLESQLLCLNNISARTKPQQKENKIK